MAELCKTKIGYNSHQVKNISSQKADTLTGFYLILIAFSIQIILQLSIGNYLYNYNIVGWRNLTILALVIIAILVVIFTLNKLYYNYQSKEIEKLLPK